MAKKTPFADRIKELREERKLNQTQLAEAAGLSPAFLSRLLAGSRELTFEHVVVLANAFGVTVGELVAGTDVEDIASKWVSYERFDESERKRLLAEQDLEVVRRENEALRERLSTQAEEMKHSELATKELPILRTTIQQWEKAAANAVSERDRLLDQLKSVQAEWEICKWHRMMLQRTVENATRQVQAVREEAARVKTGAGIIAGLSVLGGLLLADSGGTKRRR